MVAGRSFSPEEPFGTCFSSGELTTLLEDLDPVAGRVAREAAPSAEDVRLVLPRRTGVAQSRQHVVEVVDDEPEVGLRMDLAVALGDVYLAAVVDVEPRAGLRNTFGRLLDLTQPQHVGVERHDGVGA